MSVLWNENMIQSGEYKHILGAHPQWGRYENGYSLGTSKKQTGQTVTTHAVTVCSIVSIGWSANVKTEYRHLWLCLPPTWFLYPWFLSLRSFFGILEISKPTNTYPKRYPNLSHASKIKRLVRYSPNFRISLSRSTRNVSLIHPTPQTSSGSRI